MTTAEAQHDQSTSGWQLDVPAAAAYERNLVPIICGPLAAELVDRVEVKPGQRVLDVACGTGAVARQAAERVGPSGEVVGVDVAEPMLAVAREITAGTLPPIRWERAEAADLPFPDASFDAVVCSEGLQFFPDRASALVEMHRVVRPGGRAILSTWRSVEHQAGYRVLAETLTRHLGAQAGAVVGSPYALGDPEELRGLVAGAGFRDVEVTYHVMAPRFASPEGLLRAETSSSPLGDIVDALDGDVRTALLADLTRQLEPYTDDEGVVFPFQALLATATR